jgi:hypothetical protein
MITAVLIADVVLKVVATEIQIRECGKEFQVCRPFKELILRETQRFKTRKSKNNIRDDVKTIF